MLIILVCTLLAASHFRFESAVEILEETLEDYHSIDHAREHLGSKWHITVPRWKSLKLL